MKLFTKSAALGILFLSGTANASFVDLSFDRIYSNAGIYQWNSLNTQGNSSSIFFDFQHDFDLVNFCSPCDDDRDIDPPPTVPVPPAMWLLGTAIAGLVVIGRRKNK